MENSKNLSNNNIVDYSLKSGTVSISNYGIDEKFWNDTMINDNYA